MQKLNRRNFLTKFFLSSATIPLCRSQIFTQSEVISNHNNRPLEMLAIGDSVMWGQGLNDRNKFTFLVKNWLAKTLQRDVNLFVLAHSGASIENKSDNRKELKSSVTYNGEINLFNPSIKQQAINAYQWYNDPKKIPEGFSTEFSGLYGRRFPEHLEFYKGNPVMPENVDLILANGGINDLDVRNFVNPTFPKEKFPQAAEEYCYGKMKELLQMLISSFPNARIIVPGYFPLLSKESCPDKVIEAITAGFGSKIATRIIQRAARKINITAEEVRDWYADRSNAWAVSSNKSLKKAVDEINDRYSIKDKSGKSQNRVFFAKIYPDFIGDKNAYGTDLRSNGEKCPIGKENDNAIKRSFVWEVKDKISKKPYEIQTNDDLYDIRVSEVCTKKSIKGLTKTDRFICRRAGLFHPNKDGANAFFESIKIEIDKIVKNCGWQT